jgi:hypothetical protein
LIAAYCRHNAGGWGDPRPSCSRRRRRSWPGRRAGCAGC